MTGFRHDIAGGNGTLIVPALQSPNFIHGVQGWAINKDGSAEFHSIDIPSGSGGATIYFASVAPASPNVGDLWYNIANGLQISQWDGTAWVPYQIGTGAIANGAITPPLISNLTSSLIGNLGTLNANPYFTGGDGSGWTAGGTATFAVTNAPPAGAPFKYAAVLTGAGTNTNKLFDFNEQFSVQPSTQYLATAWVYSPVTSVSLGFDWRNAAGGLLSTTVQTFTVAANTWTQLTTVQTSDAAAVKGNINTFPAAPGGTFYAQGLIALPQVPGSLIQAGTVTATQIAAGTITTAELAAGIVYAGIIDGTTVQAAQYIADGSSGEFLAYTSAPATGNLIVSISPVAGSDSHSNAYKDGVGIYKGTGYLQAHVNPTFGAPAIEMLTGIGSEKDGAALYNLPVNVGGVNEYENVVLQGPTATIDGHSAALILSDSAKDGSSGAAGQMNFNGSILAFWNVNGVHVNSTLWGVAGTLTIGDNISLGAGKTISVDSWHPITLDSGWTAAAGFDAPRYRMLPDGNVQLSGAATHAAFTGNTALNNSNPLPSAYQPVNTHHYRSNDTSIPTGRPGVQISPTGIITALTNGVSETFIEIDGIYPAN